MTPLRLLATVAIAVLTAALVVGTETMREDLAVQRTDSVDAQGRVVQMIWIAGAIVALAIYLLASGRRS